MLLFQSNHKGHFRRWEKDTFAYITRSLLSHEHCHELNKGSFTQCNHRGLQNSYLSWWSWVYCLCHSVKIRLSAQDRFVTLNATVCVCAHARARVCAPVRVCFIKAITINNHFPPITLSLIPKLKRGGEAGWLGWQKYVEAVQMRIVVIVNCRLCFALVF